MSDSTINQLRLDSGSETVPKDAVLAQKRAQANTELYRHYDAWGRLLYVGVSMSSLGRLCAHRDTCHWYKLIHAITVERYPNRALALEAEKKAITEEKPYFNRAHRKGWKDVVWEPDGNYPTWGRDLAKFFQVASKAFIKQQEMIKRNREIVARRKPRKDRINNVRTG